MRWLPCAEKSLAGALCGVTTTHFNEQVKRNLARFPADFMFQLNGTALPGLVRRLKSRA